MQPCYLRGVHGAGLLRIAAVLLSPQTILRLVGVVGIYFAFGILICWAGSLEPYLTRNTNEAAFDAACLT